MRQRTVVSMKNITMAFSGNKVLDTVNFELLEGEVHSLVGANGAGKSTLIKILNGIYIPVSGTIEINEKKVQIRTPNDAERLGLAFVHQELNICNDLTVAENIYLGNWIKNRYGLYDKNATSAKAKELLDLMGVDLDPDIPARKLRTAEKQIIEILKALTRDAKVVILDEPTSSLNENEKRNFFKILQRIKTKNVPIIFISHFLEDVLEISDRVTVLKDGKNNGLFEKGNYTKDDLVVAMMGRKIDNRKTVPVKVKEGAQPVIELRNFTSHNKFYDISFGVYEGDIVGICGLLGAGKTEIARAIFGLDTYDSGKIFLYGKEIQKPTPQLMIKNRVAFLTEERKLEGFVPLLSIRENITLSIMKKFSNKTGVVHIENQKKFAEQFAKRMTLKMSGIEQMVVSLSGGNQQKVVIAKCLASEPKLFLLDEPTRGVDIFAKSEIYKILREAAENGTTIMIFSSELEELLANCSKIIVLKKGSMRGIYNAADLDKNSLLSLIN